MPARLVSLPTALARLAVILATTFVAGPATAAVSSPHPGLTLVQNGGRATLIIDLCASGVGIRVTRYEERRQLAESWGSSLGLQAAINADFFNFPDATFVYGRARGDSVDWPGDKQAMEIGRPYWQFGPGQAQGIADGATAPGPVPAISEVIAGHNVLLSGGVSTGPWAPENDGALLNNSYRRTAMGLSADRRTLYMMAVSQTINADTMISYMTADAAEAGAPAVDFMTNEDGGGSTQMWVAGLGQVISSTRLVANHVGVRATGQGAPSHCVPKYSGTYMGQSFPELAGPPLVLAEGEGAAGWIDLLNVGTSPWTPGVTKLAPVPRDQPSPLADASWESPTRAATVAMETPPGAVGRFELTLYGGTPGTYMQMFGLVEEGVTWFADPTLGGGPGDDLLGVYVVVEGAPTGETDAVTTGSDDGTDAADSGVQTGTGDTTTSESPTEGQVSGTGSGQVTTTATTAATGSDSGGAREDDAGCGCRQREPAGLGSLVLVGLALLGRRRRGAARG